MSLLLDARKKAQQALGGSEKLLAGHPDGSHSGSELTLEEHPNAASAKLDPKPFAASSDAASSNNSARNTGKNLFNAKSPSAPLARTGGISRNLLLALGGTVILIAAGAGYLWYIASAGSNPPLLTRAPVAVAPAPIAAAPQNSDTATPASAVSAQPVVAYGNTPASDVPHETRKPSPQSGGRIRLKPQPAELLDPLIGNAYLAYRGGKLEEARQMYLEVLGKDPRNSDALLGLAAISQQLGEDSFAAQYYLRVLALDPRNAVANAGMSALHVDENSESRLKNLLREQRDSPALHFELGNIYAGQSRWGEAQSAYFNAYTLDSKNAELAFNLAVSLDHLGQNKLAAQYYQRALQLEGGDQPHGFDHAMISQHIKELAR